MCSLIREVEVEIVTVVGKQLWLWTEHNHALAEARVLEGGVSNRDAGAAIVSQLHNVWATEQSIDSLDDTCLDVDQCLIIVQEILELTVGKSQLDQWHSAITLKS